MGKDPNKPRGRTTAYAFFVMEQKETYQKVIYIFWWPEVDAEKVLGHVSGLPDPEMGVALDDSSHDLSHAVSHGRPVRRSDCISDHKKILFYS